MVGFATIQQSAALPFTHRQGCLKLLLITSIGTGRWILPKGHIEPGLTASESAAAEALEEAGVLGEVAGKAVGSYTYTKRPEKGGERCRVKVFPIEVTRLLDEYPEAGQRRRRWVSVSKAVKLVREAELKALLLRFEKRFAQKAA